MDRVITLSDLFDCKDKGDLQEEWAELGIIVHECLDNGVTVLEIHEYIDQDFPIESTTRMVRCKWEDG